MQALADTVPPEITLIGSATVTVQLGAVYTDAGATATDNVDGDITDRIVVDNPVDTGTAGTYTVTYSVEDAAGNRASAIANRHCASRNAATTTAGRQRGRRCIVGYCCCADGRSLAEIRRDGGVCRMVGPRGIEPRTCGLRVRCSA